MEFYSADIEMLMSGWNTLYNWLFTAPPGNDHVDSVSWQVVESKQEMKIACEETWWRL
jgi:hypothetical protein